MSTEVVDPRIEREARWCYERRLERLTVRAIADLSGLHPDDGGLGQPMSHATVARRIRHYHATMLELEGETRDEARARELELLDRAARYTVDLTDPIDRAATAKANAVAHWMIDNDPDYRGPRPGDPRLVVLADPAVRLRALAEVRAQSESRRKLLGTDAPTESRIDVTVTDAATAELNAMLAEAGLPPIETEARP
jgi:hypothetical protein